MNFAADLLLAEGLSVKETASRLNFSDQFHFSRVFKRITGHSPSSLKHAAGKPAPYTDDAYRT
jgi:AraC-like DNA-binding protein